MAAIANPLSPPETLALQFQPIFLAKIKRSFLGKAPNSLSVLDQKVEDLYKKIAHPYLVKQIEATFSPEEIQVGIDHAPLFMKNESVFISIALIDQDSERDLMTLSALSTSQVALSYLQKCTKILRPKTAADTDDVMWGMKCAIASLVGVQLYAASMEGYTHICDELIASPIFPDVQGTDLRVAFDFAVNKGHYPIVESLLKTAAFNEQVAGHFVWAHVVNMARERAESNGDIRLKELLANWLNVNH